MAQFSVISDMSDYILGQLRSCLCPDIINIPEKIIQVSPADKNADYVLGLYLFDMVDSGEFAQTEMRPVGEDRLRYPPKSITLYYMLFVNSKLTVTSKASDEQRILGRVIQFFHDTPVIDHRRMPSSVDDDSMDAIITMESLKFEDKTKIWQAFSIPVQLALFFRVAPVLISSDRVIRAKRVIEAEFGIAENKDL